MNKVFHLLIAKSDAILIFDSLLIPFFFFGSIQDPASLTRDRTSASCSGNIFNSWAPRNVPILLIFNSFIGTQPCIFICISSISAVTL